jgi:hypothetical protein
MRTPRSTGLERWGEISEQSIPAAKRYRGLLEGNHLTPTAPCALNAPAARKCMMEGVFSLEKHSG